MTESSIPQIDFSSFDPAHPDKDPALVKALGDGIAGNGFVAVVGHGVPDALVERVNAHFAAFFALPVDVKKKTEDLSIDRRRGYTPFGVEHAKDQTTPDLKEFWHVGRSDGPDALTNPWPEGMDALREDTEALFAALDDFGMRLLSALSVYLEAPADQNLAKMAEGGQSILRILHYPPRAPDAPEGAMLAAEHEDINLITLLPAADAPGLEILDKAGTFIPVVTPPRAIIVDAGDMLQRLTAGRVPATTHRVVDPPGPPRSRHSMPFFVHPRSDVTLAVLPSCADRPGAEPPIRAGEFLDQRLRDIGLIKD